jgi:hypothetical protein
MDRVRWRKQQKNKNSTKILESEQKHTHPVKTGRTTKPTLAEVL